MTVLSKKSYHKFQIQLTDADRKKLNKALKRTNESGRFFKRAMALRLLDLKKSVAEISEDLGLNPMSVRNVGHRFQNGGIDRALNDAPRPGKASLINSRQEKEIIALACSDPPGEKERWTLNLRTKPESSLIRIENLDSCPLSPNKNNHVTLEWI